MRKVFVIFVIAAYIIALPAVLYFAEIWKIRSAGAPAADLPLKVFNSNEYTTVNKTEEEFAELLAGCSFDITKFNEANYIFSINAVAYRENNQISYLRLNTYDEENGLYMISIKLYMPGEEAKQSFLPRYLSLKIINGKSVGWRESEMLNSNMLRYMADETGCVYIVETPAEFENAKFQEFMRILVGD